jgi:DNA-binding protein H-NS
MATLKELLEQETQLLKEIAEARQKERGQAIATTLELIKIHKLTKTDLFGKDKSPSKQIKSTDKEKALYQDPLTGKTWNGHGRKPDWIKSSNKDVSEFKIAE